MLNQITTATRSNVKIINPPTRAVNNCGIRSIGRDEEGEAVVVSLMSLF
jgi:hypothetical protein